jgi:hypothetical protein
MNDNTQYELSEFNEIMSVKKKKSKYAKKRIYESDFVFIPQVVHVKERRDTYKRRNGPIFESFVARNIKIYQSCIYFIKKRQYSTAQSHQNQGILRYYSANEIYIIQWLLF